MAAQRKLITVSLPRPDFVTLDEWAAEEGRTPQQQGTFLLLLALRERAANEAVEGPAAPDG